MKMADEELHNKIDTLVREKIEDISNKPFERSDQGSIYKKIIQTLITGDITMSDQEQIRILLEELREHRENEEDALSKLIELQTQQINTHSDVLDCKSDILELKQDMKKVLNLLEQFPIKQSLRRLLLTQS